MRSFLLILILAFSITGCQQINSKQSVAINDSVIVHQKKLMASLETFVQALESKEMSAIENGLEALQKSANDGITAVKAMESPNCDDQFLPASIELFDYYQKAAETEYKTIGYLYGIDSISYEQYDSLQVLIEDFKANQKSVNDRFLKAQRLFADNCDFKLVKHED
ncbi:MAG: hypothetical protein R2753_17990 [Chitinophagales bacterium]